MAPGLKSAPARARGGRGQCACCGHPRQADINAELAAGRSFRSLAAKYGVSRPALASHKRNHLSPALVALHQARGGESVVDQLHDLVRRARRQLESAELAGNTSQALAAIREARETLALIARATGEDEPARGATAIDVQRSEEWAELRGLVFEFVPPERRAEFARRLKLLAGRRAARGG